MQPKLIALLIVSSIVSVWIVSSMGDRSDNSKNDTSGEEQDSPVGGRERDKPEPLDIPGTNSTEIWNQDSDLDNRSSPVTGRKNIKCPQCGERCDSETEFCGNCGSGLDEDMIYLHCRGNLVKVPYQESIGSQLRDVVVSDGESKFEAKKISRDHIRFVESDGSVYVIDLDSEHGTTLNGSPLKPNQRQEVSRGDILRIASTAEIEIRST